MEQQVVPGYASTQAGTMDLGQVNFVLSGQPPHRGGWPGRSAGRWSGDCGAVWLITLAQDATGWAYRPGVLYQIARRAAIARLIVGLGFRGRLCRGFLAINEFRIGRLHLGDGSPHGYRFSFRGQYPQEGPFYRGGHLHGHLVCNYLHQRIKPAYRIAGLLQPLADGTLDYRFSDMGKLNGDVQGRKPRN